MSRIALSLMAATSLAACATTGQHANAGGGNATLAQNGPDNAAPQQRAARATPPRTPDRHAREQITGQDMLTQMAFWAGEYDTFPNDLEAAQRFAETLRKGG